MDYKTKCFVNNKECELQLQKDGFLIDSLKILFMEIKSVQIKNAEDYYLKVTVEQSYIIKFTSLHTRDLIKSFCSTINHPDLNYFVEWPILLKVFEDLNVSLTQFVNYLKLSYFFNIKNSKNVIDRMIGSLMKNDCNNFASRINNISTMSLQEEDLTYSQLSNYEKVVDFQPIFPLEKEMKDKPKLNDFTFGNFCFEPLIISKSFDSTQNKVEFDKKDLEQLLHLKKEKKDNQEFVKILEKKYGHKKMKYLKRLI